MTPLETLKVLLQSRRLFVFIPLTLFALVVGLGLTGRRSYSSGSVFVPQLGNEGMGAASGLAASLGISLPGVDLTQTPDFYVTLISSPGFLGDVVDTKYRTKTRDGDSVTADLITLFDASGDTQAIKRDDAVDKLTQLLNVGANLKTGVVTARVKSYDAGLSLQMAQRILQLVNAFNAKTRQTRAGQERQFAASRLLEARQELRLAEDSLRLYQERNRMIQSSPYLMLGLERLQREVVRRDQLVSFLSQKYDQARVEEARTTAAITLVESPRLAARPDRRGLAVKGLMALIAGVFLAAFVAWARQFLMMYRREDPMAWEDVVTAWNATTAFVRPGSRRAKSLPVSYTDNPPS